MKKHMGMGNRKNRSGMGMGEHHHHHGMGMTPGQNKDDEPSRRGKPKKKQKTSKMGMGKSHDNPGRTGRNEQKNSAEYVRSLGNNVVTSLVGQTTTSLTVSGGHRGENTEFACLVSFVSYGTTGTVTCADSLGNTYVHAAHVVFNTNYSVDLFYVSGVKSIAKNAIITVTHPSSTRRIVVADEFKGLATSAADQTAQAAASVAATFVTSGETGLPAQAKEMVYGVFGINGPATDDFKKAHKWTLLHDRGTAAGDGNDVRLITEFRTVDKTDASEASGTLGTARLWGAITQGFKSLGGASDIDKDV